MIALLAMVSQVIIIIINILHIYVIREDIFLNLLYKYITRSFQKKRKEAEMPSNERHIVICQKWEESERGWGTRPDGYTLHLTDTDRKQFVQDYWDKMPDSAPDEYSRPCGTAYPCEVDDETFLAIKESKNGVWKFDNNYPLMVGTGRTGVDGWMTMSRGGHGKRPCSF